MLTKQARQTVMPASTFKRLISYFYTNNTNTLNLRDCGWILALSHQFLLSRQTKTADNAIHSMTDSLLQYCDNFINNAITGSNWEEALQLAVELENIEVSQTCVFLEIVFE